MHLTCFPTESSSVQRHCTIVTLCNHFIARPRLRNKYCRYVIAQLLWLSPRASTIMYSLTLTYRSMPHARTHHLKPALWRQRVFSAVVKQLCSLPSQAFHFTLPPLTCTGFNSKGLWVSWVFCHYFLILLANFVLMVAMKIAMEIIE